MTWWVDASYAVHNDMKGHTEGQCHWDNDQFTAHWVRETGFTKFHGGRVDWCL